MFIIKDKDTLFDKILSNETYSYLLEDTIIVQHFIQNHFESLFKAYAIGNKFEVLVKRTIPHETLEKAFRDDGYLKIG